MNIFGGKRGGGKFNISACISVFFFLEDYISLLSGLIGWDRVASSLSLLCIPEINYI